MIKVRTGVLYGAVAAAVVAAGACGGDDLTLPSDRLAQRIVMLEGDAQEGTAGQALADSLVVRVIDAAGDPVAAAPVVFTVLNGGDVAPDTARTDGDGRAAAHWVLAPTSGVQRATARVAQEGAPANLVLTFTAAAGAPTVPPEPTGAAALAMATEPPTSAAPRVAFPTAPRVRLVNASGNPVAQAGVAVTAGIASGNGTLLGTLIQATDAEGVAAFPDLAIDGAGGAGYTLRFSSPGLAAATSRQVRLDAPAPAVSIAITSHTPSPADQGRAVRFEVRLQPPPGGTTPSDTFRVAASTGESCVGVRGRGQCEIVFDSPGTRSVTATFPGDATYGAATSAPVSHTVNAVLGPTRTTMGLGPDPANPGQRLTAFIEVRATAGLPGIGIVNLYGEGSSRCGDGPHQGTAELDPGGNARMTVTAASTPGLYVYRVCFSGAPGFAPSEDLASVRVR